METDKTIAKLEGIAAEMQSIYYDNEVYMNEKFSAERNGLDNVTGNMATYDLAHWLDVGDYEKAMDIINANVAFFDEMMAISERLGYGARAASRGFDVTKPASRYWTLSMLGQKYCNELIDHITNK